MTDDDQQVIDLAGKAHADALSSIKRTAELLDGTKLRTTVLIVAVASLAGTIRHVCDDDPHLRQLWDRIFDNFASGGTPQEAGRASD